MDLVFLEEQKNLAQTEKQIDDAAQKCAARIEVLNKEIESFHPVDPADIEKKKLMIIERAEEAKKYRKYISYKPSPYFGRMDLEWETRNGDKEKTFYIGKKGLAIDGHDLIYDWRAEVGQFYYIKNQKAFNVKGTEYTLLLRRALEIRNAQLIRYNTEYDGNTISLKGDVIDPFLLSVLQDKKKQKKLTDIIQTIQENQNNMIRRPFDESFAVQGCAGSGKTMILLHRLSYLKFNNKAMSVTGIKIITPNCDFDMHINDLSHELGLDSIQRMTVEEYYVHLIRLYSADLKVNSTVASESTLNPDLLSTVYSSEFFDRLRQQYEALWEDVLWIIDKNKLWKYFFKYDVPFPQVEKHHALAAEILSNRIHQVAEILRADREKAEDARHRKENVTEEYIKEQQAYDKLSEDAGNVRHNIISDLHHEMKKAAYEIEQIRQETAQDREAYDKLKSIDENVSDDIKQVKQEIEHIRDQQQVYLDYDQCVASTDEISALVCNKNAELINKIKALKSQIDLIPIYNFVKKNALKKELNEAKNAFSAEAKKAIDSLIKKKESVLPGDAGLNKEEKKEMQRLAERLKEADLSVLALEEKRKATEQCVAILSSDDTHEMPELPAGIHNMTGSYLSVYEKLITNLKEQSARMADVQKRLDMLDEQIDQFKEEDLKYIETCEEQADRLQVKNVYKSVFRKELMNAYYEHGEEYTKINYRHKLLLVLLLCMIHYKRIVGTDVFLNIDEAQDISVEEYKLIKWINGDKCRFNLYGDINQTLYPQRGITDWSELESLIGNHIYVLNENYRNTLQITEYCNKEFDAEIFPIGINGEEVKHMNLDSAVQWLSQIRKNNPDFRIALIVKKDDNALRSAVDSVFSKNDISWFAVDDRKVSVLTVENAKGLEFDAVAVVCKDMMINELYIAYTRALDNLCIVKDNL